MCCARLRGILACVLLILGALGVCAQNVGARPKFMIEYVQDIERENAKLHVGDSRRAVLMLGDEGAGISTLTMLLTTDFKSIEFNGTAFNYKTSDKNGALTFEKYVPNILVDSRTNTSFYDGPSFKRLRSDFMDVASAYSTYDLLNFLHEIKIVFSVNFVDGDESSLITTVKNAAKLIKNISKYSSGIALVVIDKIGQSAEASIKTATKASLQNYMRVLEDGIKKATTEEEREFQTNQVHLIKTIAENEARMGVMKRPEGGYMQAAKEQKNQKKEILQIVDGLSFIKKGNDDFGYEIFENALTRANKLFEAMQEEITELMPELIVNVHKEYIEQNCRDDTILKILKGIVSNPSQVSSSSLRLLSNIGTGSQFAVLSEHLKFLAFLQTFNSSFETLTLDVSDEWADAVANLHQKIQNALPNDLIHTIEEITNFYMEQERLHFLKIDVLNKTMHEADEEFSPHALEAFMMKLSAIAKNLHLHALSRSMKQISRNVEFLHILSSGNVLGAGEKDKIDVKLTKFKNYIKNSRTWYNFLLELRNYLSTYVAQRSVSAAKGSQFVSQQLNEQKDETVIASKIGINSMLQLLSGVKDKNAIENVQVNKYKLNAIQTLWKNAMSKNEISCTSDRLIAKGYFVSMSEVAKASCWSTANFIDIFALSKVFIDIDTGDTKENSQMTIISPTWQIIQDHLIIPKGRFLGIANLFSNNEQFKPTLDFWNVGNGNGDDYVVVDGGGRDLGREEYVVVDDITGMDVNGLDIRYLEYIPIEMDGETKNCSFSPGGQGSFFLVGLEHPKIFVVCNELENAPARYMNPSPSILAYKEYLGHNLLESTWRSNLLEFVQQLSRNEGVHSFYSVADLIDEFKSLENHYNQLKKEINFVPLYQSLLDRIGYQSRILGDVDSENKKHLTLLYTAVMSKIISIKDADHIVIFDVSAYLRSMKNDIDKIEKETRIDYIKTSFDKYEKELTDKIGSAVNLVETKVIPAIDATFRETDEKIADLLQDVFKYEKDTENALKISEENNSKMKKLILCHKLLAPFKLIGRVLSFAGPKGMIASAVISAGVKGAEKIAGGAFKLKAITANVAPVNDLITKITNDNQKKCKQHNEHLDHLLRIIRDDQSDDFQAIKHEIDTLKKQLNQQSAKEGINFKTLVSQALEKVGPGLKTVDKSLGKLMSKFEAKETGRIEKRESEGIKIHEENDKELRSIRNKMKIVSRLKNVIGVVDTGFEIYDQLKDDERKLSHVNKEIDGFRKQLNDWQQHEENIYNIMMPQLKLMETSIQNANRDLNGKDHLELDISKWQLQSALQDLKLLFRQMAAAQHFTRGDDLDRCIDKINEGVTVMISLYDHIDSYAEKEKLATLMTGLTLGSAPVRNPKFQDDLRLLDRTINTNLMMERYQLIIQALKQHKFPYAKDYLNKFELSSNLRSNDTEIIKKEIMKNVDTIIGKINSLRGSDHNDASATDITRNTFANVDSPFYTWRYEDYQSDIEQLLNGEEVILKADITKGLSFSAVKFKNISINFKLNDPTKQTQLNTELEKVRVKMTMIGENYYRCDNRVYYIPMDGVITFLFGVANGQAIVPNVRYETISKNNYFLSPYTTWKIQLLPSLLVTSNGNQIKELKKFKNEKIDLLLTGMGQVMYNEDKTKYEICSDELDQYYSLYKIL